MAPRFEDIPAELLVNITSYLSTPDYGNVRRTCSMVEKKLFDSFGKEFFKRKQFMLTRLSLQALIDISNHESLRLYLTKVIIGTNLIPHPGKPSHSLYRSHVSNAPLNGQTRSWQREQYLDQRYLIDHGLDTTMLEEALNNLPFCHEIEIRDVWSPDRGRGNEKWTSYGSTDFLNRSGHSNWPWWSDPSNHGRSQHAAAAHSHPWVHHVFSAVTTAMASVGNSSKFTAFMITTRLNDNDLDEDAFYMPQSNLNGLTEAFRHITTLMLPIHTCSAYSQNGPLAPALGDFGSFLRLFPNLTHLRLNGFPAPDSFDTTTEWLKKAQEALASSPIRRLDLGKLHMQREAFVTFLSTFKALEHLELHRVRLVGSWNDPFGQIHDSLSSLSFVKVYQLDTGSDLVHPRIGFKASADAKATTSKDLVQTAVFKGSKWQEDISGRLVVQDHAFLFPDGDSGSDDSDDSGDPDDYNSDVDANDDNDDDIEVDDEE